MEVEDMVDGDVDVGDECLGDEEEGEEVESRVWIVGMAEMRRKISQEQRA